MSTQSSRTFSTNSRRSTGASDADSAVAECSGRGEVKHHATRNIENQLLDPSEVQMKADMIKSQLFIPLDCNVANLAKAVPGKKNKATPRKEPFKQASRRTTTASCASSVYSTTTADGTCTSIDSDDYDYSSDSCA